MTELEQAKLSHRKFLEEFENEVKGHIEPLIQQGQKTMKEHYKLIEMFGEWVKLRKSGL